MTIATNTPASRIVEWLKEERDGKVLDKHLRSVESLTPNERQQVYDALLWYCATASRKSLLPAGIEPETLTHLGIPFIQLPESGRSRAKERLDNIVAATTHGLTPVSPYRLERLADGDDTSIANRSLNSLIEVAESRPLLYCEPAHSRARNKGVAFRIGTGGVLRLYWVAERTSYAGGCIYNAMIEIIGHASSKPPAEGATGLHGTHLTMSSSVQFDSKGYAKTVLPTVASDESYGITEGMCDCRQLAR